MAEERRAPDGRRGRTGFLSAVSGIALAAFVAAAVPAHAQQIVGSGETSVLVNLDNGETLIVEEGGTVRNSGTAVAVGNPGGTVSVINRGTIESTGSNAINIVLTTLDLINSGTILGANAGVFADAITSLVNTGTISGDSIGVVADGRAAIVNHGTIRGGTEVTNDGINIDYGTVINTGSGLIEGRTGIVFATTISGRSMSVTNAGRIRSTSGPAGTAIFYDLFNSGPSSLTVLGRSTIEGRILWNGGGDTFTAGPGWSSALTIEDRDTVPAGTGPTVFTIDTNGLPFAVERTAAGAAGTARTKVVVIDPSSFGLADSTLADITGGISGVLTNQAGAARNVSANDNVSGTVVASANGTSMTITPVADHGPVLRAWADVFGGWRGEERDGNQLASDHVFGGAVAGIETDTAMDGMRAGVFIGGSGSKVDVEFGSQDTEIGSVFGGFYAAHQAGDVAIDAALTVGLADYDQQRFMNDNTVSGGVDTARADYYGIFVSPEITVSSSLAVADWMAVKPSLTLRYAGLFLDGYTEKGSNANLKVEDRDVHIISARAQVAAAVAVPVHMNTDAYGTLTMEIRVGADGRATIAEDNVRATLLGQNLNFTAGGDDEVLTGFAGAAFAYAMTTGTRLYANIEAGYGTDEAVHVTGRAGVKMPF